MTEAMLFPARFGGVLELLGYECETLTAPEQAQLIESIGTDDARRPAASSPWRRQLNPRGFSLVMLDKDGQVKQRKPSPWSVREITRAIDKFPLRLQEIGRAGVLP